LREGRRQRRGRRDRDGLLRVRTGRNGEREANGKPPAQAILPRYDKRKGYPRAPAFVQRVIRFVGKPSRQLERRSGVR